MSVYGKNMEVGEDLKRRIVDRVNDDVEKYLDNGFYGKVKVEK